MSEQNDNEEELMVFEVDEDEQLEVNVLDPECGCDEDGVPYSRQTYVNGSTGSFRLTVETVDEDA